MDALAEKLDQKLRQWNPETAAEVIQLTDRDVFDLIRSRSSEQEVLDLLDESSPGGFWLADLGLAVKTL